MPAGTQTVTALVSGGLDGCTYKLFCEVQSSNSEVLDRTARLGVSTGAA